MTAPRSPPRRAWLIAMLAGSPALAEVTAPTVDVWVDLSEPVPADGIGDDTAQRQRVDRQQREVAAQLQQLGGQELARIRHTRNAIAVRIDPGRLDAVRAIPGVRRVRPTAELHPPELLPSDRTK